jgi:murein DD-endopeptidase MepM/ murein hydrolase activator NlpD
MIKKYLLIALGLIILGLGVFFLVKFEAQKTQVSQESSPSPTITATPSSPTPQTTPTPTPEIKPKIVAPIDRYGERKTLKYFGKLVTSADTAKEVCGKNYTGYHTGDDLEIFSDEIDKDVPVYSIADGKVRQVGHTNGYGGLIVIQYTLNNQIVTAYYGHIVLSSATIKAGDLVQAGQQIATLGKQCSSETDGERKHLHFAIHQGTSINVKGYVQTQAELSAWIDPKNYF